MSRYEIVTLDIENFYSVAKELQQILLNNALELAEGDLEKEVEAEIGVELALYARDISPFWTGALASSHIVDDLGEAHFVHINPSTTNPITGDRTAVYGVEQHEMGGWRAFYDRAVTELGPELLDQAEEDIVTSLELFT